MTEQELRERWVQDEHIYSLLGDYVTNRIKEIMQEKEISENLLKIPPIPRTKNITSLVEKAFYRGKKYVNPYEDITDKVGVRFVVLIKEDIKLFENIIENEASWSATKDRDFFKEQRKNPNLFGYESVHYIVRLNKNIQYNETLIPQGLPCEIQIRSLLQHACSELTHDAIYKAKFPASSEALRACAKAIALSEAVDDCFMKTFEELENADNKRRTALNILISYFKELINSNPQESRLTNIILHALMPFMEDNDWKDLKKAISSDDNFLFIIKDKFSKNILYSDPNILLIYYFLKFKKNTLEEHWPLTKQELLPLALDFGETLSTF